MRIKHVFYLFLLCFFLRPGQGLSQSDSSWLKPYSSDITDFSIQNLEEKVSITSQTPLLVRDAPGTVTVITENEIQSAGARDLGDVLRLIPGIEFNTDVQGVIGIGMRGNSANEAVLILVDGIEMNELLFGSNQFGNHFPIDQIRRIEIIRGPGSVIYGGFAVFGVINILTKASEWQNGLKIAQTLGETRRGLARRNFSASFGQTREKFRYSITTNLAEANRSDKSYTDLNGNSYDMFRNSSMSTKFVAFSMRAGNFFLKGMADENHMMVRDNQTVISSRAYPLSFTSYHIEARYQKKINENISLFPFFNFRNQLPWHTPAGVDSQDVDKVIVYKIRVQRYLAGTTLNWKPRPNLNILSTASLYFDQSKDFINPDSTNESAGYSNVSLLSQASWKTKYANITAGLRYDKHSYYKAILSPRIALTRSFGKWYLKTSFNRSFRTPALSNISLSIEERIQPQITDTYEAECGLVVNSNVQLSLNLFRVNIKNGIVFSLMDDGFTEGYSNAGKMGTQGLETESKFTIQKFSFQTGYSFYTTSGVNSYEPYAVSGKPLNLAYPAHKFTLLANYPISKKLNLKNTFIFLSDRYGFYGSELEPGYLNYGKTFQWNLFFQATDVFLKGFNLGCGMYDITNSNYNYIQSYNSGHMPLPNISREIVVKMSYGINMISGK